MLTKGFSPSVRDCLFLTNLLTAVVFLFVAFQSLCEGLFISYIVADAGFFGLWNEFQSLCEGLFISYQVGCTKLSLMDHSEVSVPL